MIPLGKEQPNPDSDRRLGEAILYVASRMRAGRFASRGAVKLNKVLWRADFEQFRKHGKSVTGAEYQKIQWGPAPVRLLPVRSALEDNGDIALAKNEVGAAKPEDEVVPRREPDTSMFTAEELAALDEAVAFFENNTGSQTADISHEQSAGWKGVRMNDVIPYETALVSTEKVNFPDGTTARIEALIAAHRALPRSQR